MPNSEWQILLVDDNKDICEMMTLLLGLADFKVSFAQTMAEGWRLAQSNSFDLCLLDSQLPDGSGYDLCRQIRDFAPDLPVVFYSGHAYETDRQQGLAAGAQAYLVKPNDMSHIEAVMSQLIAAGREPMLMRYPQNAREQI